MHRMIRMTTCNGMMNRWHLLSVFLFFVLWGCQSYEWESNLTSSENEEQLMQLAEAAKTHIEDVEKAKMYAQELLSLAMKLNDKKGVGNAYNILGSLKRKNDNYLEALKSYLNSVQAFESVQDTVGQAKAYNNIGNIYRDIYEYDKAIAYYQKALALHTLAKNKESMAITNRNLGLIYQSLEDFQKAKDSYWTALYIWKRLGNENRMAQIYNDLSIVYDMILEKGEYLNFEAEKQIALNLNLNALDYYERINDVNGLAKIYINIGRVYTYQPSKLPLHYFNKVLTLPIDQIDPKLLTIAHINIGLALLQNNEEKGAIEHFLKAEQFNSNEDISVITLENLAASLEQNGEIEQSIFYYKKLNDLRKKLRQVSWSDEVARIEARYAIEYAGL